METSSGESGGPSLEWPSPWDLEAALDPSSWVVKGGHRQPEDMPSCLGKGGALARGRASGGERSICL